MLSSEVVEVLLVAAHTAAKIRLPLCSGYEYVS